MLDTLGGRKFLFSMFAMLIGIAVAVFSPKGLDTQTVALILGLVGSFHVTNAAVSIKAMDGSASESEKELPTTSAGLVVDYSPALASLQTLGEQQQHLLQQVAQGVLGTQQVLQQAMAFNQNKK